MITFVSHPYPVSSIALQVWVSARTSPLSSAAGLHQCRTSHSHYIRNARTFSGQTSYLGMSYKNLRSLDFADTYFSELNMLSHLPEAPAYSPVMDLQVHTAPPPSCLHCCHHSCAHFRKPRAPAPSFSFRACVCPTRNPRFRPDSYLSKRVDLETYLLLLNNFLYSLLISFNFKF